MRGHMTKMQARPTDVFGPPLGKRRSASRHFDSDPWCGDACATWGGAVYFGLIYSRARFA